jgi:hypothetical protein
VPEHEVARVRAEGHEVVLAKLAVLVDVNWGDVVDLEVLGSAAGRAGRLPGEVIPADSGPLARPTGPEQLLCLIPEPSKHGFRLREPLRVAPPDRGRGREGHCCEHGHGTDCEKQDSEGHLRNSSNSLL